MYATTGMNLGNIMPSKVYQSQKDKYFAYMKGWLSGISKFIETECKIEFGGGVFLLNRYKVSDWDDAKALGRPEGFTTTIREIRISAGAGFIVALTGNVMTMPGLPKKPAAEGIDVDGQGIVTGLF